MDQKSTKCFLDLHLWFEMMQNLKQIPIENKKQGLKKEC